MTSATKPEVYIRYRNAMPVDGHTHKHTQNLVKFGRVVFNICQQTHRQIDRQTDRQRNKQAYSSQYFTPSPVSSNYIKRLQEVQ